MFTLGFRKIAGHYGRMINKHLEPLKVGQSVTKHIRDEVAHKLKRARGALRSAGGDVGGSMMVGKSIIADGVKGHYITSAKLNRSGSPLYMRGALSKNDKANPYHRVNMSSVSVNANKWTKDNAISKPSKWTKDDEKIFGKEVPYKKGK